MLKLVFVAALVAACSTGAGNHDQSDHYGAGHAHSGCGDAQPSCRRNAKSVIGNADPGAANDGPRRQVHAAPHGSLDPGFDARPGD